MATEQKLIYRTAPSAEVQGGVHGIFDHHQQSYKVGYMAYLTKLNFQKMAMLQRNNSRMEGTLLAQLKISVCT